MNNSIAQKTNTGSRSSVMSNREIYSTSASYKNTKNVESIFACN